MAHPAHPAPLPSSVGDAKPRAEHKIAAASPDRSLMLFFALVAATAFLATQLFVEDNLFILGWQILLSHLAGGNDRFDDFGHGLPIAALYDAAMVIGCGFLGAGASQPR